jgi:hypothetical protein
MKFTFVDGTHSIRRVVTATARAFVKQPKAVLKYTALRVLDMDGDLTELLDSVWSLELRLPRLLHVHKDPILTQLFTRATRAATRVRYCGMDGMQALQDAFEERGDPIEVAQEEVEWAEGNVEPAWNTGWDI